MAKSLPVIGVAASAGTNIVTTYLIGQRANAYFSLGPEAMGDWTESVRAITGVDERRLIDWLTETTEQSWALVKDQAHDAAGSVITASKSAGDLVVETADKAKQKMAAAGRSVADGASSAAIATVDLGRRAGEGIAAGADRAGAKLTSAGQTATEGARAAASSAAEKGQKAREGVAASAGKAGEAVSDVGKSVAEGAGAAKKRLSKRFGRFKRDKAETEPDAENEASKA